jgi:short subunit dehydrogenase-like uncharacterized protein
MTTSRPVQRKNPSRELDLVLFGATGFTGRLVAEYLAKHPQRAELRWALAGRNPDKLERVRAGLGLADDAAPPIIVADSHDRAGLDAVMARTAVVCTTVGPYAQHGSEVVASAVAAGTDYCDLTGEVQWIARMIEKHHEAAQASGARIVHCCGFDSIPSDLGTLVMNEAAKERYGRPLDEVRLVLTEARGGASGGTIASLLGVVDEARKDPRVRRLLREPYALNPEGERSGPDAPDLMGVRREPRLGIWVGPFVMAAINTRVVRRSNALLGYAYGRDFRYGETMGFGAGPSGFLRAAGVAGGLGAVMVGVNMPPLRTLMERRLPAPGEGPDAEARRRGHFTVTLLGTGRDREHRPITLDGRVVGTSDPGYGETSKMLSESALCLALEGGALESPGGVTTPAASMGMRLVERLRAAGMTFAVD